MVSGQRQHNPSLAEGTGWLLIYEINGRGTTWRAKLKAYSSEGERKRPKKVLIR